MSANRREFLAMAGAAIALTVLNNTISADSSEKKDDKPEPPFQCGPLSGYTKPGVYDKFKAQHRVLLVSDGNELVALNTKCPHQGGEINWEADKKIFKCQKQPSDSHGAEFSPEGVNAPNMRAKRPMRRFAIRLTKGDSPQVEIDPGKVFRNKDEWGDPEAFLKITN